ncbi:hypothetical protein LCGC14_0359520 [marine sediment metagenome]|uniref:Uncharacterized protein n=1 Tax=marine sediment metagenome TaxID=412755 RepID=A0A0F9TRG3_9ZZZZ
MENKIEFINYDNVYVNGVKFIVCLRYFRITTSGEVEESNNNEHFFKCYKSK